MKSANTNPTIAIVGRPNVGKSTLFNRLSRKWTTIVEDRPGITRDRIYAQTEIEGQTFTLIDTGGLNLKPKTELEKKMSLQARQGMQEANVVLFVMDGREGLTQMDREWVAMVRKLNKPTIYAINKLDDPRLDAQLYEFEQVGAKNVIGISAETQRNFSGLYEMIMAKSGQERLADRPAEIETPEVPEPSDEEIIADVARPRREFSIAIIGRPNVGKSTLLNTLLGEERAIVDNAPGTTRDAIHSVVTYKGEKFLFVDTAGIRKRAKSTERVEKFSIMQSLKMIDEADICLLLIDGVSGPAEQDAHVAGYAFEKGKALIVIVNKWDEGVKKFKREDIELIMERKMNYLANSPVLYVSAKTGKNTDKIFTAMADIRKQYDVEIKTSDLNRAFEYIVDHHALPVYKGHNIKMYYATQIGRRPPTFAVFSNHPKAVHFSYKRYVTNALREMFKLENVPVRVVFKQR